MTRLDVPPLVVPPEPVRVYPPAPRTRRCCPLCGQHDGHTTRCHLSETQRRNR